MKLDPKIVEAFLKWREERGWDEPKEFRPRREPVSPLPDYPPSFDGVEEITVTITIKRPRYGFLMR